MSKLPIQSVIQSWQDLLAKLAQTTDPKLLIELSKEQKKLQTPYELAEKIRKAEEIIQQNQELLATLTAEEKEMAQLLQLEIEEKREEVSQMEEQLLPFLSPADPQDDSNILLEIRAGAGGDEAALFAGELMKTYYLMAEELNFQFRTLSFHANDLGGYKEIICEVRGVGAYSWFKQEGGVHRVQRVPATEKQGRVHTSTVSVAVMPLIEDEGEFKLNMNEVEIIVSTSQGAGGQSVNTTYSAVKVRHLPTGIEASCQDERSQQQNRIKALQVLTSRVFNFYEQEKLAKQSQQRREQIGRADRSEKIRTYNFPQDRVTDHRYNRNWNQIQEIMNGGILEVVRDIKKMEAERNLANLSNKA